MLKSAACPAFWALPMKASTKMIIFSRQPTSRKTTGMVLLTTLLLLASTYTSALEITQWRFQTSLYTRHWDPSPEHVNHSKLLSLEFDTDNNWLYGFAYFQNSFGQPSQYLYAGRSWKLFNTNWAYVKLTGGLLHGYKKPYEDKIPFNKYGVAPAIVPSIGLRYKRVMAELQILGTAAITVTAGFSFGNKPRKVDAKVEP